MKPWESFKRDYPNGVVEFETSAGYTGVIVQNPHLLHLCGYVIVPNEHPLCTIDYDERDIYTLEVHGGVTFTGQLLDYGWAIGFDCNHLGDLAPSMEMMGFSNGETYKNEEYVRSEIEYLASQIKENE